MTTKYYISSKSGILIVRKKKRTKGRVYADLLFTSGGEVYKYSFDRDLIIPNHDWDAFFIEPRGIIDKEYILRAIGI